MRDADVRAKLLQDLARMHAGEPDTLILEELGLCEMTSRIDVAVVNGSLNGYEIKSARDTLERLPAQIRTYNRVFDTVTIVTHRSHLHNIRQAIPKWWGIIEAQGPTCDVRLGTLRQARPNCNIDAYALAQLLWREEVLQELESRGLAVGLRSKRREELWLRLAASVPRGEISAVVRGTLKQRSGWRAPVLRT